MDWVTFSSQEDFSWIHNWRCKPQSTENIFFNLIFPLKLTKGLRYKGQPLLSSKNALFIFNQLAGSLLMVMNDCLCAEEACWTPAVQPELFRWTCLGGDAYRLRSWMLTDLLKTLKWWLVSMDKGKEACLAIFQPIVYFQGTILEKEIKDIERGWKHKIIEKCSKLIWRANYM